MDIKDVLRKAIPDYVSKTKPDAIGICSHFKGVSIDITYKIIKELEDSGKINRVNHFANGWNGNHHYETPGPHPH